jgi:hypothetical protein
MALLAACGGSDDYFNVLEPLMSEIGILKGPIHVIATRSTSRKS